MALFGERSREDTVGPRPRCRLKEDLKHGELVLLQLREGAHEAYKRIDGWGRERKKELPSQGTVEDGSLGGVSLFKDGESRMTHLSKHSVGEIGTQSAG